MDSKERFSNRVDSYVKYRPSYPNEAIDYLYEVVGLRKGAEIADIGAGTGIFSRHLLERGSRVTALEPNEAMRQAAVSALGALEGFQAAAGSAEETGLPAHSVDFIVCAQSFHWFDKEAAKAEFHRILKPGGKAVLIWNSRITQGTPFLEGYERLLHTYCTDYDKVGHKFIDENTLITFFKGELHLARFTNRQIFNFEELTGRLLSSSYAPTPEQPQYEPMMAELKRLFEQTQHEGHVLFDYETEVYWGEV